jgi:ribosomal protein S12 methylthiotransferase accessory factor
MDLEVYFEGNKKVNAKIGDFIIQTDQPLQGGGEASAPAPFELFLASLGTCVGIYIKSFCDQRDIDANEIKIKQRHTYNLKKKMVEKIDFDIVLPDSFPTKYKDALASVIDMCAVKKHLFDPPEFIVNIE